MATKNKISKVQTRRLNRLMENIRYAIIRAAFKDPSTRSGQRLIPGTWLLLKAFGDQAVRMEIDQTNPEIATITTTGFFKADRRVTFQFPLEFLHGAPPTQDVSSWWRETKFLVEGTHNKHVPLMSILDRYPSYYHPVYTSLAFMYGALVGLAGGYRYDYSRRSVTTDVDAT